MAINNTAKEQYPIEKSLAIPYPNLLITPLGVSSYAWIIPIYESTAAPNDHIHAFRNFFSIRKTEIEASIMDVNINPLSSDIIP